MFASGKTAAVSSEANYIEDVFSTYLYTGNGSTQTITNGIDLSTKGGLVWVKGRNETYYHRLASSPGPTLPNYLASNATDAASSGNGNISAFTTTGFTVNNNSGTGGTNSSGINYTSWTFRKQPKFFDVVTYTGNGTAGRQIAHSLGSVPGCIIIKCTSTTDNWIVYHRSIGNTKQLTLNTTDAQAGSAAWNTTDPTSTVFTVGLSGTINGSGRTYVAYLFAHDAGGFGLTGTDNVISCGSYTASGSSGTVTLGYEPQWVLIKNIDNNASGIQNWQLIDNMRGMPVGSNDQTLYPNLSDAEASSNRVAPTATGFSLSSASGNLWDNGAQYIYIAIRRGPMKVPTSGTSVYNAIARTGTGAAATVTGVGFAPDLSIDTGTASWALDRIWIDKLRGAGPWLRSNATTAETANSQSITGWGNNGVTLGTGAGVDINDSGRTYINWYLRRAPSFFDEVCYTGNGTAGTTQTHNLKAVPEMMIVKDRNYTGGRPWVVYHSALGATKFTYMDQTTTPTTSSAAWNDTTPTSSVFTLGSNSIVNFSGTNYVAYLFATCAGVSKVGSYTGTGALQTINCGFTSGARFVYIHRTDSAGDWWVYDSARGITSGNDPYLLMNSAAAETTGTNYVDTDSTGFKVTAAAPADLNASGGTYIFLAVA